MAFEKNAALNVPTTKEKKSDTLVDVGAGIINNMSDEEKGNLGSMSSTLHFQNMLGLMKQKRERVCKGGLKKKTFLPVGITLVSDVDIDVPVIDIEKNQKTGVSPEDIGSRHIKGGKPFDLTQIEFMYLIIRPEYSNFCTVNGDPRGCYFSAKVSALKSGKNKMPTPTVNFKVGSPKENMLAIDEKDASGKWKIKPEYEEKFGALLKRKAPMSGGRKQSGIAKPIATAAALRKMLGIGDTAVASNVKKK